MPWNKFETEKREERGFEENWPENDLGISQGDEYRESEVLTPNRDQTSKVPLSVR